MFIKYPKFFLLLIAIPTIIFTNCCSTNNNFSSDVIKNDYLELEGSVSLSEIAEFKLQSKRLKVNEGEYLPNSENFRVEIYNKMGKLVYNSNYMQNYFMAIGKVLPQEVGGEHTYSLVWDYKSNDGKKVPNGEYSAKLIIPATPKYYFVDLNFDVEN